MIDDQSLSTLFDRLVDIVMPIDTDALNTKKGISFFDLFGTGLDAFD